MVHRIASPLTFVAQPMEVKTTDKMDYGLYPLRDRWSMDQVPEQNRGPKETVAVKGSKSVRLKKKEDRLCQRKILHFERHCSSCPPTNPTIDHLFPRNTCSMGCVGSH